MSTTDSAFGRKGTPVAAASSPAPIDLIAANFPVVFWTVDRDLRFTSSFGKGLAALGLRDGQVIGMTLYEFFGTTDKEHPAIRSHLQALSGTPARYEFEWKSRWYDTVLKPIVESEGSVCCVAGFAMDITDYKRNLRGLEAVYRISAAAFESSNLEEFYTTLHEVLKGLMEARNFYIALHNREHDTLHFSFYVDERDTEWGPIPADMGLTGYVFRTGKSFRVCAEDILRLGETENVRNLGPLPACWLGVPLRLPDRIIGVLCVQSYDPTACYSEDDQLLLEFAARHIAGAVERRRIEDALSKSEERYRSFIAHSSEGIWCFGVDEPIDTSLPEEVQIGIILEKAHLIECNDTFARMYGYETADEIAGIPLKSLLPPEDPRTTEYLRKFIRDGYRVHLQESHEIDRFGNRKIFLNNFSGTIKNGKLVCAWGTQTDITERRRLEEELQRAQRFESLNLIAGGIAHDFNNLLTGIIGNLSLARVHASPQSEVSRLIAEAEDASERARALASQLLTFARGGAPIKKVLNLSRLIKSVVSFSLSGSRVKREFSLPPDLWHIEGDPAQLSQVFQNLALNAAEAMPDGGTLSVSARNLTLQKGPERPGLPLPDGSYVEICVTDTGKGIPEEDLPHIFEPFFTRKPGGSGLGLAIAYSVVRRHDGLMTVHSTPNAGTSFLVYLPAVPHLMEKVEAPLFNEPVAAVPARILIMDDESIVRQVLCKMLARLGYDCVETADGAEAVSAFWKALQERAPFAAVIVDLTVPGGMGGREALPLIREMDPNVPVIVSSGYSSDLVMANYREFGFNGIICKPFRLEDVQRCLREVLQPSS